MKRLVIFSLILITIGSSCRFTARTTTSTPVSTLASTPAKTPASTPVSTPVSTVSPSAASSSQSPFGVMISGENVARPEIVQLAEQAGAQWVRVNVSLDGQGQDYSPFLEAGINLVLTIRNDDPSNMDTTYGSLSDWPNAGFPYKDKAAYQERVSAVIAPLAALRANGTQVWVQAENEVGDAALSPKGKYWRGTTDQYLSQLQALYEAVKSVSPDMPVVLSSFTSEGLDAALDPTNEHHEFSSARITRLLAEGQYDAVDLHFYGCVEDIPAKVAWVKANMPADKLWISTENGGPDPRCATTPHSWTEDLSRFEEVESQQVPERLSACAENGGSVCLWFSFFDLKNEDDVFSHLGLLDQSVLPPRQKPAFSAFQQFVEAYR